MKKNSFKLVVGFLMMAMGLDSFAYIVGVSSHPFGLNRDVLNTEFNNHFSSGSAQGLQVRYLRRVNTELTMEAGVGVTDGDRASRAFAGADYVLFPEYMRQPRISLKGFVANSKEFDNRHNTVGVAPIISKGFNFWGREAFPFISLPTRVSLADDNTYETQTSLALGVTGALPVRGYEHITANVEGNINLRNDFTSLVVGIAMPLR